MKVIGIRRIEINNNSGTWSGYKYYCTEPVKGVAGLSTDSFTISDRQLDDLNRDICLDDEVIPVYKKESKTLRTVVFMND